MVMWSLEYCPWTRSCKVTTWDMEHMLDNQSFWGRSKWRRPLPKRFHITTKIFVSSGTSENTSTTLWMFGDKANSPNMQNVLCHSQLPRLAIGNYMCNRSQAAREANLLVLNESIHKSRCQTLWAQNLNSASSSRNPPIPLETNYESISFLDT